MDFDTSMRISASGMSAHRTWLNVTAANLANANTTRTADGEPYERRTVLYEAVPETENFEDTMAAMLSPDESLDGVRVADVLSDKRDFREIYDPSHPDADERGIVLMPNISPVEEMAHMMNASRSYEANLTALNTAKKLAIKALDIGK